MPWSAVRRSLRIYFLNHSRGVGCLVHSLGHDMEFRYNESSIHYPGHALHGRSPFPFLQADFRRFADFDLDSRRGLPFDSLYRGGDTYDYEDCTEGVCRTLAYPGGKAEWITGCGNVHYPPGAHYGYDYAATSSVSSFCETFMQPDERVQPITSEAWASFANDSDLDDDCGGGFLTYWMNRMPGFGSAARRPDGAPAANWWVYQYY